MLVEKLWTVRKLDVSDEPAELSVMRREGRTGVVLATARGSIDLEAEERPPAAAVTLSAVEAVELVAVLLEYVGAADELRASVRFRAAAMAAGLVLDV